MVDFKQIDVLQTSPWSMLIGFSLLGQNANTWVAGREINFFSDSHLAPKFIKVVAN